MPRAWTVTDLHFGDSGKGTITEALVRKHGVDLVARFSGGCQCAHHVVQDDGVVHCFAQYGSGTLAGASTLLTQDVLIDPLRMMKEREVLKAKGCSPVAYVHEDALVVTPFHAALNRLKERARGEARHGSCGVGIGETAAHALAYPHEALRIRDLISPEIARLRLTTLRDRLAAAAREAWEDIGNPFRADARADASLFEADEGVVDWLANQYEGYVRHLVRPVTTDQQTSMIASQDTVWEGAQGVLLDEDYGLHPYTTWSRVTLRNAARLLEAAGVTDVINTGVLRAYGHRHGAGPFPTEEPLLRSHLVEGHNGTNAWQGAFRVGWFDALLARYALSVAGGTEASIHMGRGPRIDQLAITHLDTVADLTPWRGVTGYGLDLSNIPAPDDWSKRERLTACLGGVRSEDWELEELDDSGDIPDWIAGQLGVPVTIRSYGPTYADKVFASTPCPA